MRTRTITCMAAAMAVGCSSGGGGSSGGGSSGGESSSLDSNCNALCNKVSAAGCQSQETCLSQCEDLSSVPASCQSAYDTLIACGATSGSVGCTSSGESIGRCDSQAQAVADCVKGSSPAATCPSGSYSETCNDVECTTTTVTASCRTSSGTYLSSSLALPCSSVSNCNGQLTCSPTC